MKKIIPGIILLLIIVVVACNKKPDEDLVQISTPYGDIVVKLYDKTPLHHRNFMKLAESGYYNGTLFHRVIEKFMIQGGDPVSRHAKPGQLLGEGDTNYTIPFEYVPEYIHKRGVLAAARESDDVNPAKASSGSQFYIVQGKRFTNAELDAVELKVERRTKQYILMSLLKKQGDSTLLKEFKSYVDKKDTANIRVIINRFHDEVEAEYLRTRPFKLDVYQREVYSTVGGTPHLDGAYTVFGEVVSGMDVVDKIASVQKDTNDRPLKDIPMSMKIIHRKGK
ncbi:MAG: peptidylprolyl isomerase [Bacteroidetes bacterium]|nr:peptidylprolyl isomerase [Bacteroidota bacterium]